MNKNTVCKECGKHFVENEGIFVIKPDEGIEYHLCDECFKKKRSEDEEFELWFDNDIRALNMSQLELEEEFGCGWLEELNLCSYWTQFEDEGDNEDDEEIY